MKRSIFFVLLSLSVLIPKAGFSECVPFYFRIWPEGETLNRNPMVVLNFSEPDYPWSKKSELVAPELGKKIRFFFKSGHSSIPLRLIQRNRGKSDENQVILKPARLLEPGVEYTLEFFCQDSVLAKRFLQNIRFRSRSWVVKNEIDKEVPVWLSEPVFQFKNYVRYGCGPESYWKFCASFKDQSAVFIQTIVRHLESGKISEYLLLPDTHSLVVGYHMCGGAFNMVPGEHYSVSFNLVDASGNTLNQFSDPVFVQAPTESDYLSDEEVEKKKCSCVSDQNEQEGKASLDFAWILGIVALIVLLAVANWYRNAVR